MPLLDIILLITAAIIAITLLVIFMQRLLPKYSIPKEITLSKEKTLNIEDLAKKHSPETLWKAFNNQIVILHNMERYSEAAQLAEEALKVVKEIYGAEHIQTATAMNNLGSLYKGQGKFEEGESLLKGAIKIWGDSLGKESTEYASGLNNLADLYNSQEKYIDAETIYKKSLEIFEKALGKDHPNVATVLENLANLYNKTGNTPRAAILEEQARLIRAKSTQTPQ